MVSFSHHSKPVWEVGIPKIDQESAVFSRALFLRAVGTGLVCLGLLAFEILTTRLLSVVIDASTILTAIAFAMLGMTVATSMMSLRQTEAGLPGMRSLPWLGILLGVSYLGAMLLVADFNTKFNGVLEQAIDEGGQVLIAGVIRETLFRNMALIGAILFIPYFLFGTFIALLFGSARPDEYHRLYAADLIGAALGCVLAVWVSISSTSRPAHLACVRLMANTLLFWSTM